MLKLNWKHLVISILIPVLLIGGLSSLFVMNFTDVYGKINTPPLSPPGSVFPVVWTILFILMGVASYIVFESADSTKRFALIIYAVQLALNFTWTITFFRFQNYWLAVFVVISLLLFIILNIYFFGRINTNAGWLLAPYFIWVLFATYLTTSIAIMN